MKLRIKGNSVRLRVLRPEVSRLIETGSIEERVYFAPSDQSPFTYALKLESGLWLTDSRRAFFLPRCSLTPTFLMGSRGSSAVNHP